jgi:energy-coupling factor transporter ATP-binding protein EcfA2
MVNIADFRGARGSNSGDQFHELWALEQVLALLDPKTNLKAVTVEGIPAEQNSADGGPHWDSVDCALFYSGEKFETAELIDLVQLKYSSDPKQAWSVSRLCKNTAKKGNNSLFRKLAVDYRHAQKRKRADASLKIRLISNQSISEDVLKIVTVGSARGKVPPEIKKEHSEVVKAIGLKGDELANFFESLDFSECGCSSRFTHREKVIRAIGRLIEGNAAIDFAELTVRIRELMLGERYGEFITARTVLSWFDVSDFHALFPCPQKINATGKPILREVSQKLIALLHQGHRLVCLHGPGGCGKTTMLLQLKALLPEGSSFTVYDCFGAGQYLFADEKRHLPENAFLQITNELALDLGTPFLIPRGERQPLDIGRFLKRLADSSSVMSEAFPDALLVVAIDAADNAVTAATRPGQPEKCFVRDLCNANIQALPLNVRIVISARSSRLDTLCLPKDTPDVVCPPFSLLETTAFVQEKWSDATEDWIDAFHRYSHGIPRVQGYAAGFAGEDSAKAIQVLQPGKGLREVLRTQFDDALKKIGQRELYEKLVAAMSVLPPPIPSMHLAAIAGTNSALVDDFVNDLYPGLVSDREGISIADEDFEDFIDKEAQPLLGEIKSRVADHLSAHHETDVYAATHIADALVQASRNRDLLPLVERHSSLSVIPDPVVRREVQLKRLRLALHACRHAGSYIDMVKTIIISADANKDETRLKEILTKNTELAVCFAWPTLRRLVLSDSDRVGSQGSILAQDAVRAARVGDHLTAKERLVSHDCWMQRRRQVMSGKRSKEEWRITDDDIVARSEAIYKISGIEAVLYELRRWHPKDIPLRVGLNLIRRLVVGGYHEELVEVLESNVLPGPWGLLVSVPIALAGISLPPESLAHSLSRLRPRHIPKNVVSDLTVSAGWKKDFFATLMTACELAVWSEVDKVVVTRALRTLSSKLDRRFSASKPEALDAAIRIWLLDSHLASGEPSVDIFLESIRHEESGNSTDPGKKETLEEKRLRKDRFEKLSTLIKGVFPIYVSRLSFITQRRGHHHELSNIKELIAGVSDREYLFEREYESKNLRAAAAASIMSLMAIPGIPAKPLYERAAEILSCKYSSHLGTDTIPLINPLVLRHVEHSLVLELVTRGSKNLDYVKCSSSEKSGALLSFSRLLLPVSFVDSQALFATAIELAKELDHEAYDQIRLLRFMSGRSAGLPSKERRRLASEVYRFVSGAAERLDYDGFPWEEAAGALARLSPCVGLAAVSRWADDGTREIHYTLDALLADGLALDSISPDAVAALMILTRYPDDDLVVQTIKAVKQSDKRVMVASEFAKDCLLHKATKQLGKSILSCVSKNEELQNCNLLALRKMVEFLEQFPGEDSDEVESSMTDYSDKSEGTDAVADLSGFTGRRRFTSADAIREVLDSKVTEKNDFRSGSLLHQMREATQPADRVAFLNALIGVELGYFADRDRGDVLLAALDSWQGPALDRWKVEQLPQAIIKHFATFSRWIEEQQSPLPDLMSTARLSGSARFNIIVEGIEKSAAAIKTRALYALAKILAEDIPEEQIGTLISWGVDRIAARIPIDQRHVLELSDIPTDINIAVGRFLYTQLADIDTRIRWRAAHAIRRLARFHAAEAFDAVTRCYQCTEERSFQLEDTPFYWLAARLWLVMTINRISSESPEMVLPHLSVLSAIATDHTFPHALIQEHAKRAIVKLVQQPIEVSGDICLEKIQATNVPHAYTDSKGYSYRSFNWEDSSSRHFQFDSTDSLRYWYSQILAIFPTLEKKSLLDFAEEWIVDRWSAPERAHWWDLEPRKGRYDEHRYNLWSNRHGTQPTIERYATYLEWQAMFCVVGELLNSFPVSRPDSSCNRFSMWLQGKMPTLPNSWFSDLRQPTPLEDIFWRSPQLKEAEWVNGITLQACVEKLGCESMTRAGWIIIACAYDTQKSGHKESTRIFSALIDSKNKEALHSSIINNDLPEDFYVPGEDLDSIEDEETLITLTPWLSNLREEVDFDRLDPLLNGLSPVQHGPGRVVTEYFELVQHDESYDWYSKRMQDGLVFTAELWSDHAERENENYGRASGSGGWRLWMRKDLLEKFLLGTDMHLVCEIELEREMYNSFSYRRDEKNKLKQIAIIDKCGSIELGSTCLRTWK